MNKYKVGIGRIITRNNLPIAVLSRIGEILSPSEADSFVHEIVIALNYSENQKVKFMHIPKKETKSK